MRRRSRLLLAEALWPRVREAWIVNDRLVGQRLQELNQVFTVLLRKHESADQRVLVWIVVTVSRVRSAFDGPPACRIMIEHSFQRRNTAVVHVRRGQRDIPQCWRLEFSYIGGFFCVLKDSGVDRGIGQQACKIVESGIVKFDWPRGVPLRNGSVGEGESTVAAKAGEMLVEEQNLTSLDGVGNRVVVAAIVIAIIGRTRRDDAPLETGQRFGDVEPP